MSVRPDGKVTLDSAACLLAHTGVDHGEAVNQAVAVAVIVLPGEVGSAALIMSTISTTSRPRGR